MRAGRGSRNTAGQRTRRDPLARDGGGADWGRRAKRGRAVPHPVQLFVHARRRREGLQPWLGGQPGGRRRPAGALQLVHVALARSVAAPLLALQPVCKQHPRQHQQRQAEQQSQHGPTRLTARERPWPDAGRGRALHLDSIRYGRPPSVRTLRVHTLSPFHKCFDVKKFRRPSTLAALFYPTYLEPTRASNHHTNHQPQRPAELGPSRHH